MTGRTGTREGHWQPHGTEHANLPWSRKGIWLSGRSGDQRGLGESAPQLDGGPGHNISTVLALQLSTVRNRPDTYKSTVLTPGWDSGYAMVRQRCPFPIFLIPAIMAVGLPNWQSRRCAA